MTPEELNEIIDALYLDDTPENNKAKILEATADVIYYSLNDNNPAALTEFLVKTREKLEKAYLSKNVKLDSSVESDFIRDFLDNPVDAIKNTFKVMKVDYEENRAKAVNFITEHEAALRDGFKYQKNAWVDKLVNNKRLFDEKFKYDNSNSLNEAFEKNKGGFFERLFNTTSKQFKDLRQFMQDFQNEDSPRYGDVSGLKAYANDYIKHKIPSYKMNINNLEGVEDLDSTGRERVNLCKIIIENCQAIEKANSLALKEDELNESREALEIPEEDLTNTIPSYAIKNNKENEINNDEPIIEDDEIGINK